MRVVLSWLNDYVDLSGLSADEIAERWTLAGLEVESIERIGDWWDRERLLVGEVVRVEPHPNADRLVLADVNLGGALPHRVVTGAPNLLPLATQGDLETPLKVAFAREGVELFDGHAEGWVKSVLKGRKVRGIMSDAMVCSEKELGISEDHEGILILSDDAPVGAPLVEVLGDTVVTIDIQVSFARAMSMIGVARETAVIFERELVLPSTDVTSSGPPAEEAVRVVIENPDLCPRYAARLIRGVEISPSPGLMARRLRLAGMRPISNVVDITNYVMLEWGEPLHAFDYDRLVERAGGRTPTITIRRAHRGERMTTLDDVDRALDADTLVIADDAGPVAIAGVMGGAETEIDDGTENILLEAAAFNFINIRRTSRLQKIFSESAARFSRGVHPDIVDPASRRASALLAELGSGEVAAGVVDEYPSKPATVTVSVPAGEIRRVLGIDVPHDVVGDILSRLEFDIETGADGSFTTRVPRHRMDVDRPADVIEEIARVYGYDRLPETTPTDPLPPQRNNPRLEAEEAARDLLVRAGLQEIISYRLVSESREADVTVTRSRVVIDETGAPIGIGSAPREEQAVEETAAATASTPGAEYLTLLNPVSRDRAALRHSILTGLLESARGSRRYRDRVAIFEVGPVFVSKGCELPEEPTRLGLLMTGPVRPADWRENAPDADFYHIKGIVESLAASLGSRLTWSPGEHPSMRPGRTARVTAGEKTVGWVGELHPLVADRWDLGDTAVVVADLDFYRLWVRPAVGTEFQPLSTFPAVHEDLAVVVDDAVPAERVEQAIREAGGGLLVGLGLFDVYRGRQIEAGKKSLAWSLTFQAPDKTLTSDVVAAVRGRVVKRLEEDLGATIRSS